MNVYASSGTSPEYTIQGFFNDTSGEYPLDSVAVGDIIYVSEGSTCVRLRVDTINSSAGGILNADVYDVDTILLSPPSGIGALMRETGNIALPRYIPGLSETLLSCIRTHMTGKVDEGIQHPFSTVSSELEIDAGELKFARQGANPRDALRWNSDTGQYEPTPIASPEFIDSSGIEFTVCNDGSCDFETPNQAFKAAALLIPGYDSLTTAAIKIRIKNNADSSPSVFSETSQILQGDFSNVTIVSNDTFYYSGTSTAFLFQNCSPPAIDSLKLRGLNTNTFGLNYFSTQGKCRISNSHVDSFRIQLYLRFGDLDLQKTWLVNGRGSNATNIWLENISAYTFELHCGYDTPGVNAGCFRAIGSNRIWLRRVYASNDPSMGANNMIFRGLNGNIYIDLNGGIDSLTSENVSGYNAYTIDVSSTPPNPINFIPVNTVTDQGVYAVPGTPYSFQESTTADEPAASSGIRFYYNTDEEELKISDGVSWYGINTIAGISVFSNTTAKSLYTMSSGVNVEFESSSNSPILYLSESNKRVGIGTDNPQADLNIVSTSGAPTIRMKGTGSVSLGASFGINNPSHVEFWNFENGYMRFGTNNTEIMRFVEGQCGVGVSAPQAALHLKAGTSSIPSLRIIEGVSPTSPADGDINHVSDNLLFTSGTTVYTLAKTLTATASLDFSSTSAQNSADLTITVTGAADGDAVSLGVPNAAVNANTSFSAWVSAANTVTVRFNNYSSGAVDPANGTFRVAVLKY